MTSNAPGCGTSISSIWNASTGSPSRSSRMTQAAILSGSVPGSTVTSVTSRVAMREEVPPKSFAAADRTDAGARLTRQSTDVAGGVVRERHHRELRIHAHSRGEDAGVADVQVLVAVDAAVLVHDPFPGVRRDRVAALRVGRVHRDVAGVLDEIAEFEPPELLRRAELVVGE